MYISFSTFLRSCSTMLELLQCYSKSALILSNPYTWQFNFNECTVTEIIWTLLQSLNCQASMNQTLIKFGHRILTEHLFKNSSLLWFSTWFNCYSLSWEIGRIVIDNYFAIWLIEDACKIILIVSWIQTYFQAMKTYSLKGLLLTSWQQFNEYRAVSVNISLLLWEKNAI